MLLHSWLRQSVVFEHSKISISWNDGLVVLWRMACLILHWICVWKCVIVLAIVIHVEAMLSICTQDAKHVLQKLGLFWISLCERMDTYEHVFDLHSITHAMTKLASCRTKPVGTPTSTWQILNDGVQQGLGLDCVNTTPRRTHNTRSFTRDFSSC